MVSDVQSWKYSSANQVEMLEKAVPYTGSMRGLGPEINLEVVSSKDSLDSQSPTRT